ARLGLLVTDIDIIIVVGRKTPERDEQLLRLIEMTGRVSVRIRGVGKQHAGIVRDSPRVPGFVSFLHPGLVSWRMVYICHFAGRNCGPINCSGDWQTARAYVAHSRHQES